MWHLRVKYLLINFRWKQQHQHLANRRFANGLPPDAGHSDLAGGGVGCEEETSPLRGLPLLPPAGRLQTAQNIRPVFQARLHVGDQHG